MLGYWLAGWLTIIPFKWVLGYELSEVSECGKNFFFLPSLAAGSVFLFFNGIIAIAIQRVLLYWIGLVIIRLQASGSQAPELSFFGRSSPEPSRFSSRISSGTWPNRGEVRTQILALPNFFIATRRIEFRSINDQSSGAEWSEQVGRKGKKLLLRLLNDSILRK